MHHHACIHSVPCVHARVYVRAAVCVRACVFPSACACVLVINMCNDLVKGDILLLGRVHPDSLLCEVALLVLCVPLDGNEYIIDAALMMM